MQFRLADHHLVAVVHSEMPLDVRTASFLDVGCGEGRLIAALHHLLAVRRPELAIETHGFDVSEPGVQPTGFFEAARATLSSQVPTVDWTQRLRLIAAREPWPYPDASFDWVLTNHVMEHVADLERLFREIARVLKPGGKSANLFPVRDNVLEGHVHIPFAHWIRDHDRLRAYLRAMTVLGFGDYRVQRRKDPSLDLARFAETRADYLTLLTHYATKGQLLGCAKRAGLRASFRYTEHFYWNKLRSLLGRPPTTRLRRIEPPLLHGLVVALLSRISSITLLLEKKQTFVS